MPKWSATTLLRELTDYQLEMKVDDNTTPIIDATVEKSRRKPVKKTDEYVAKKAEPTDG